VARLKQSLPGNMPPAANAREVYSAQSHSAWAGQLHEQTEAWQPRCLPLVSVFNELEHIRRAGIDRDDIVRDWTLRRLGRRRNTLGRRRNTARRWHDATRRRAASCPATADQRTRRTGASWRLRSAELAAGEMNKRRLAAFRGGGPPGTVGVPTPQCTRGRNSHLNPCFGLGACELQKSNHSTLALVLRLPYDGRAIGKQPDSNGRLEVSLDSVASASP
jgi:hypothetical protein